MLVIPAIDLDAGRCVRLVQGDFDRQTVYGDDPVEIARRWADLGARWLHVVDLDGARAGRPAQLDLVERIARVGVPVQLGGGLRSLEHVREALERGATRVVLGTAAVEAPDLLRAAIVAYGAERVVLGVDARDGLVATRGWRQTTTVRALDVVSEALRVGVERVVFTDIARDGTLSSPNYAALEEVVRTGARVIASGGVASRAHLERLAGIDGVEAAIVGRALYDGTLSISGPDGWWMAATGAAEGEGEGA